MNKLYSFFFQAEDGMRDLTVTGVQTCALPICSWSDWFHETADPWRDEAWDIIRRTPRLTYQILTKRPERIADHLPADWGPTGYPNVWMGVSVENYRFTWRLDILANTPARIRFLSA